MDGMSYLVDRILKYIMTAFLIFDQIFYTFSPYCRQERLEQLARKFERKAKLRESWLKEMSQVLDEQEFGKTSTQVEANVKKHEAISADILPRVSNLFNWITNNCGAFTKMSL